MVDRLAALRNALVLQQLPDEELIELAGLVRTVELKAGEIFTVRGQPARGLRKGEERLAVDRVVHDATPLVVGA